MGLMLGVYSPAHSAEHLSPDKHLRDSIAQAKRIVDELGDISEEASKMFKSSAFRRPAGELPPLTIEGRLAHLKSDLPLIHNSIVQQFIDKYSTQSYKNYFSRMLGLGSYYFDLYDRIFAEVGVPTHLKYLSVVESALNPHAVSRAGATGLWQFMYTTAKVCDLQINSELDERKDPIASTYAAARYLLKAYEQFGDWFLALAAYNCGSGNVSRAIQRSGLDKPDYWSLRPFLPAETRNYVPSFIAMTYMFEYHTEHAIVPADPIFAFNPEVVHIQTPVKLSAIARALEVDLDLIKTLNPGYKKDLVQGSPVNPRRILLPTVQPTHFDPNLKPSANSLHDISEDTRMAANSATAQAQASSKSAISKPAKTYVVKRGDTLSAIAARHKGSTVRSIKLANNLKTDRLRPGMKLQIN
jgi:membrane-bound lytic murein transglycosylase D